MASRTMLRAAATGTTILAAAALSSCSSALPVGPFGEPRSPGTECIPLRGAKVITDGWEGVRNHSTTTAVIDRVALTHPKGLRVIRAYVVPAQGEWFGFQRGYPPGQYRLIGWQWDRRQDANGARVPPSTGKNDYWNLLLVIEPVAARGTAAGIDIWYHVGSSNYHLRIETALVVPTKRRRC